MSEAQDKKLYGLIAEFNTPEALLEAAKKTTAAGYKNVEAYSPFPIHHLHEALGMHKTKLPMLILIGGILGCVIGFGLQYFCSVIDYPLNIGGRPLNSWPAFLPITFELTVLGASLTAVFGMIIMNGFPKPYNPLFNVDAFEKVTSDKFFICIESADPQFKLEVTTDFLKSLNPENVLEVNP